MCLNQLFMMMLRMPAFHPANPEEMETEMLRRSSMRQSNITKPNQRREQRRTKTSTEISGFISLVLPWGAKIKLLSSSAHYSQKHDIQCGCIFKMTSSSCNLRHYIIMFLFSFYFVLGDQMWRLRKRSLLSTATSNERQTIMKPVFRHKSGLLGTAKATNIDWKWKTVN